MAQEHGFQPAFDNVHVRLRRRYAGLGLFLERVQHMDGVSDRYDIHRPEGVPTVVFRQFVDT